MKRKNQNKSYRARVVTFIIVFKNIYQVFRQIILPKHMSITMSITNQCVAANYCLINSAIDTLRTLLWRIFVLRLFKG